MLKLPSTQNNRYHAVTFLTLTVITLKNLFTITAKQYNYKNTFPGLLKKMKYFLCYVILLSVFQEILT